MDHISSSSWDCVFEVCMDNTYMMMCGDDVRGMHDDVDANPGLIRTAQRAGASNWALCGNGQTGTKARSRQDNSKMM